jgi:hypothetical protein
LRNITRPCFTRSAQCPSWNEKFLNQLYGVAFHDIYHAGQIRLLRRLTER